jgi:hypothetical protein
MVKNIQLGADVGWDIPVRNSVEGPREISKQEGILDLVKSITAHSRDMEIFGEEEYRKILV